MTFQEYRTAFISRSHVIETATMNTSSIIFLPILPALQVLECVELGVQLPGVDQRPHDVVPGEYCF